MHDKVNHPKHYTSHPSGVECIQITEHMSFNLGNAVKYIWRADLKGDSIQDLEKAVWYIQRELSNRQKSFAPTPAPKTDFPIYLKLKDSLHGEEAVLYPSKEQQDFLYWIATKGKNDVYSLSDGGIVTAWREHPDEHWRPL